MDRVKYRITLRSTTPLLLSNQPIGEEVSIYHSKNYITGSSLRGAFIELWKNFKGLSNEELTKDVKKFFLQDGYIFENAYIKNGLPLPNTAQSCKSFPGFEYELDGHGVKDVLLAQYAVRNDYKIDDLLCNHENCSSMLKPYEAFVSEKYDNNKVTYSTRNVTYVQSGHVAINPVTGTNEKGKLYFDSAIAMNNTFQGIVHVPKQLEEDFKKLTDSECLLRVGSKRTAGYGEVLIESIKVWKEKVPSDYFEEINEMTVRERFSEFQKVVKEMKLDGEYFSLTFLSDAIIKDRYFRFHNILTASLLTEIVGGVFKSSELVHQSVQTARLTGWNHMWRTATEDNFVIRMGSTYLYKMKEPFNEEWETNFQALELNGLGERIGEGFGQLIICHPFHQKIKVV